ncbi:hypothetical protein AMTR_s00128p00083480 [Amborella trichopoda]|uniref:Uncharacterized protein n=1 Tax=Amborella trichopoda TaxID=13333 RepID=W1NLU4_AMBTC|nr:hypothetical protein AMTR_s00128p00083480 [Amborella trichopoda]
MEGCERDRAREDSEMGKEDRRNGWRPAEERRGTESQLSGGERMEAAREVDEQDRGEGSRRLLAGREGLRW